jgi:hypothetical protein
VREFKRAWQAKDITAIIGLLDPDATTTADGGGLVTAFLDPIHGGERVAAAYVALADRAAHLTILERTVNGRPGLVALDRDSIVSVYAFDIAGDRIRHIWVMRNPDKLAAWLRPGAARTGAHRSPIGPDAP